MQYKNKGDKVMENAKLISVPEGETKTSCSKRIIENVKELEKDIKRFSQDAKHFDKETNMRMVALVGAIKIIKERLTEAKRNK